jgi:hypothetical protein
MLFDDGRNFQRFFLEWGPELRRKNYSRAGEILFKEQGLVFIIFVLNSGFNLI